MALAYEYYSTDVQAAATLTWYTVTLTGGELNAQKYHDVVAAPAPDRLCGENLVSAMVEHGITPALRPSLGTLKCANEKDPPFG